MIVDPDLIPALRDILVKGGIPVDDDTERRLAERLRTLTHDTVEIPRMAKKNSLPRAR